MDGVDPVYGRSLRLALQGGIEALAYEPGQMPAVCQ
jgi:hypothetical protein